MKPLWLTLTLCGSLFTLGCGGDAPPERPGSPDVYARIDALTDCAALQAEFDAAERNQKTASGPEAAAWSVAYMKAADSRMRSLGCYKK